MASQEVWTDGPSQVTNIGTCINLILQSAVVAVLIWFMLSYTKAADLYIEHVSPYIPWLNHLDALGLAVFFGGVLAFIRIIYAVIYVSLTSYNLSKERFIVREGVFSRTTDNLEIYRVKDLTVDEPLFLRLFGLGNLILETSDKSHPILIIEGVSKVNDVSNLLRECVERERRKRGVRELDM